MLLWVLTIIHHKQPSRNLEK